jgi:hypothetical protein
MRDKGRGTDEGRGVGAAASGGWRDEGWWDEGHHLTRNEGVAPLILVAHSSNEGRGMRD